MKEKKLTLLLFFAMLFLNPWLLTAQYFEQKNDFSPPGKELSLELAEDDPFRDPQFLEDFLAGFYRPDNKIVGGELVNIRDYPWQVSVQTSSGNHFCGGAIIHEEWILTASHCLDNPNLTPSALRIRAGFTTLSSSEGSVHAVEEFILYPDYSSSGYRYDIALIKLASPLLLDGETRVAVPMVKAFDVNAGLTDPDVIAEVSGWGATSFQGSGSNGLRAVDVPIVGGTAGYGANITPDMLLAGEEGKDACQGDSGGPLVVPDGRGGYKLAGIVSWGNGCGLDNFPGVYARVSYFEDWIGEYVLMEDPNKFYTFWYEDFDGGEIPDGWVSEVLEGPEDFPGWEWTDIGSQSEHVLNSTTAHNGFMMLDSDAHGVDTIMERAHLITPAIDLSEVSTEVLLSLEHWAATYGNADISIWISTNDFESEELLYQWKDAEENTTNGPNPLFSQFDITDIAAGEPNVKIRFQWIGSFDFWWFIDDVKIMVENTPIDVTFLVTDGVEPLEGAWVRTLYDGQEDITDEQGLATLTLYEAEYEIFVDNAGYFPWEGNFIVTGEGLEFEIELEKIPVPEIVVDVDNFDFSVPQNASHIDGFTIANPGDGELEFAIEAFPAQDAKSVSSETFATAHYEGYEADAGKFHAVVNENAVPESFDSRYDIFRELRHDNGNMAVSLGLNSAGTWIAASRFTPDELDAWYGLYKLSEVKFFISQSSFSEITVKVWEGGSDEGPGNEVYSETVTEPVTVGDWNLHALTEKIALQPGLEYWIGYSIVATGGYPSGADNGPMVNGKGAWMYLGGEWNTLPQINSSLNYNWGIRGTIDLVPVQWLTIVPAQGVVAPESEIDVELTFDPSSLEVGEYLARIVIANNAEPDVIIPVVMNVTPPEFTVDFTVVDIQGDVVENAQITFDGIAQPEGENLIHQVIPGSYTYLIGAEGFKDATGTVLVTDADVGLEVLMIDEAEELLELTITIDDEFGEPVEGAYLLMQGFGGHYSDEAGHIVVEVVPGYFTYSVVKTGFVLLEGAVEVGEEEAQEHAIVLHYLRFDVVLDLNIAQGGTLSGAGEYYWGEEATIAAIAATGYHFVEWLEDGLVITQEESFVFDVYEDHDFTAVFALNTYIIEATAGNNGSIDPAGDVTVNHGDDITFTITPDTGYYIEDVLVNGESVGDVDSYTFENVIEDQSIHAVFAVFTYQVTVSVEGNGTISPDGVLDVDHGDDIAFELVPGEGYHVADILVNDVSVGSHTSYTLQNVTDDLTVHVIFELGTSVDPIEVVAGLKVFPNPVSDYFVVESGVMISQVRIYNLNGQLVHSVRVDDYRKQLSTSGWDSGVYLVQVIANEGAASVLLNVQK